METLTQKNSLVQKKDIEKLIQRYFQGREAQRVCKRVLNHIHTISVGEKHYTSRRFFLKEEALLSMARNHQLQTKPLLSEEEKEAIFKKKTPFGVFHPDQCVLIEALLSGSQWVNAVGFAGSGKTTVLRPVCEALQKKGVTLLGLAPTGKAAENLRALNIPAMTVAAFLAQRRNTKDQGKDQSAKKYAFIILDEAGMVDTESFYALAKDIVKENCHFVALGDPRQLQPVSAGRPFHGLLKQGTAASLTQVVRQTYSLHKEATQAMGRGDMNHAFDIYTPHMHHTPKMEDAYEEAVKGWWACVKGPQSLKEHAMLAHTNRCVEALNDKARKLLKKLGHLKGEDIALSVSKGGGDDAASNTPRYTTVSKEFCVGDRVVFLKNDRYLGVMNGSRGVLTHVSKNKVVATLDEGHCVSFSPSTYAHINYSYATTIHKSQGMSLKSAHVVMERSMNASFCVMWPYPVIAMMWEFMWLGILSTPKTC
jgi:ATP-dependent exoDNAse (exonuclease V) alpha subunit